MSYDVSVRQSSREQRQCVMCRGLVPPAIRHCVYHLRKRAQERITYNYLWYMWVSMNQSQSRVMQMLRHSTVYHLKSLQWQFSEDIVSATQAPKTLWLSRTHRPIGRWATNQLLLRSVTDHIWLEVICSTQLFSCSWNPLEGDLLHTKHPFAVVHQIHLYLHCNGRWQ